MNLLCGGAAAVVEEAPSTADGDARSPTERGWLHIAASDTQKYGRRHGFTTGITWPRRGGRAAADSSPLKSRPRLESAGLADPSAKDARIVRCCAAIMCRHCIPSCKRTCPFCRSPFQEGRLARQDDGESPYTYTTQDYSVVAHDYTVSHDYTLSKREYTSHQYTSADYSASGAHSYTATTDYSAGTSSYVAKDYSATDYGSSSSSSSGNGSSSCSSSSVGDKYTATTRWTSSNSYVERRLPVSEQVQGDEHRLRLDCENTRLTRTASPVPATVYHID